MIKVHLFVGSSYRVNRQLLRQRAVTFLKQHHLDQVQVDISIVGSRKIKELNESQLKHEGQTDVLSFPQHEKHQLHDFPLPPSILPHLGDIVISFPEAQRTSSQLGCSVDAQLGFYLEHALLHLLGYHHD